VIEFLKGFLIYVIIWWIVIFTVLPIGVNIPKKIKKGNAPSAPDNPLILKKFIITTFISFIVWVIVYLLIKKNSFLEFDFII